MAKILIVEDSPTDRRLLSSVVMGLGHAVVLAGDGETALRVLNLHVDTDLVITDLSMPAIDGFQLIEELQSADPAIPLIVVTGTVPGPKLMSTLLSNGPLRFVPKPIERANLIAEIGSLLSERCVTKGSES